MQSSHHYHVEAGILDLRASFQTIDSNYNHLEQVSTVNANMHCKDDKAEDIKNE